MQRCGDLEELDEDVHEAGDQDEDLLGLVDGLGERWAQKPPEKNWQRTRSGEKEEAEPYMAAQLAFDQRWIQMHVPTIDERKHLLL